MSVCHPEMNDQASWLLALGPLQDVLCGRRSAPAARLLVEVEAQKALPFRPEVLRLALDGKTLVRCGKWTSEGSTRWQERSLLADLVPWTGGWSATSACAPGAYEPQLDAHPVPTFLRIPVSSFGEKGDQRDALMVCVATGRNWVDFVRVPSGGERALGRGSWANPTAWPETARLELERVLSSAGKCTREHPELEFETKLTVQSSRQASKQSSIGGMRRAIHCIQAELAEGRIDGCEEVAELSTIESRVFYMQLFEVLRPEEERGYVALMLDTPTAKHCIIKRKWRGLVPEARREVLEENVALRHPTGDFVASFLPAGTAFVARPPATRIRFKTKLRSFSGRIFNLVADRVTVDEIPGPALQQIEIEYSRSAAACAPSFTILEEAARISDCVARVLRTRGYNPTPDKMSKASFLREVASGVGRS